MSVGIGRQNIIIMFWKEQFHFCEYINGNQTFVLDSLWPFICSVPSDLLCYRVPIFIFLSIKDSLVSLYLSPVSPPFTAYLSHFIW